MKESRKSQVVSLIKNVESLPSISISLKIVYIGVHVIFTYEPYAVFVRHRHI